MTTASFAEAVRVFLKWHRHEHRESSTRRLVYSLAAIAEHLGEETPLAQIQPRDVEGFKAARAAAGIKPITIRHDLHALSGLVKYARVLGLVDHDPMAGIKIPSDRYAVRIHPLSAQEENTYMKAAAGTLKAVAVLMLGTGIRPGEALALSVADVDLSNQTLHIRDGKTPAARRSIRLVGEAWRVASNHAGPARRGSQWLLADRHPVHALVELSKEHRRVCDRAGLRFCLYDLRHTFATRMAERGMPLTTLASILGHSSLRCVTRYVHPGQSTMNEAMERFAS